MTTRIHANPSTGYVTVGNVNAVDGCRVALVYDDSTEVVFSAEVAYLGSLRFDSHTTALHAAIQFCEGADFALIAEVAL